MALNYTDDCIHSEDICVQNILEKKLLSIHNKV